LVAQEVEAVFPELVSGWGKGVIKVLMTIVKRRSYSKPYKNAKKRMNGAMRSLTYIRGNGMMKTQLQQRLTDLRAEYESGQKMLASLEVKQANLRDTLLRISGAIQVLEEELSRADHTDYSHDAGATEKQLEVAAQPAPAAQR
jgi:predicted nuclease with TOPRIM domain